MRQKVKGICKQCEAEYEKTASHDCFCSRYCLALHKNKLSNDRWLKPKKPQKRNPNMSNLFAATADYYGPTEAERRYTACRG